MAHRSHGSSHNRSNARPILLTAEGNSPLHLHRPSAPRYGTHRSSLIITTLILISYITSHIHHRQPTAPPKPP
eukprot:scaffold69200_cov62-Cyclotella_meneghiniana.AAC.1